MSARRAMILAAGRGERLRPLTDTTPKPLVEVGGRTLIERHIDNLRRAGFGDIVINLAWLGETIRHALGDGSGHGVSIRYSPEPEDGLETAGGIIRALPLLGREPFVVVNGDILCDYPLERLAALDPPGPAHLVMIDNPGHHPEGDYSLDEHGRLGRDRPRLTFAGIGLYRPGFFHGYADGRRALRPLFDQAIAEGRLSGERFGGTWLDIGTPGRLQRAREQSV